MLDRFFDLIQVSSLRYDHHSLVRYDNVDPRAFEMSQWFNVVGAVGYLFWVIGYFLMIRKCFRDRVYGLPLLAVCLMAEDAGFASSSRTVSISDSHVR